MLLALAGLVVLGGMVAGLAPLGKWFVIEFAGESPSVSGYGAVSGAAGEATTMAGSSEDDLNWLVGEVPDGLVITAFGLAAIVLGAILLLRVLARRADPNRARTEVMVFSGAIAAVGMVGVAWTVLSWRNLDRQWDEAISEALGDDEFGFGAMMLSGIDFKPGFGLVLSGLTLAGIAALAAIAFVIGLARIDRLPITVSIGGPAAQGATGPPMPAASPPYPTQGPPIQQWPAPQGPPSGQWPAGHHGPPSGQWPPANQGPPSGQWPPASQGPAATPWGPGTPASSPPGQPEQGPSTGQWG